MKLLLQLARLRQSQALERPRRTLARHRHNTPWFVVRETFSAFRRHNSLSISASLAFYALFALIPMALLMLFLLSHLVFSFDAAIVQLAILTSNLVPKFSQAIMLEVYNISTHRAAWGILGIIALLWAVVPLARALRAAFYTISSLSEAASFFRRSLMDILAVLGILLLLFVFSVSGMMLEKLLSYLRPDFVSAGLLSNLSSLLTLTLILTAFYRLFFPARTPWHQTFMGALLTASLWLLMRPAFELFLLVNQSYGAVFGGMKNMFVSIGWLYYSFAVFLLGTELIATLRRKDVLLLRNLFRSPTHAPGYLDKLMRHFGRRLGRDALVFREGEEAHEMFFLVSGSVAIQHQGKLVREVAAGDYFGEMAVLAETRRTTNAIVTSDRAEVLAISAGNIETLLMEDPRVAMSFLREMALRLRSIGGLNGSVHQETIQ